MNWNTHSRTIEPIWDVGRTQPVKGGLSVSMNRMRKVLEVDRDAMTVRVEPGVVWGDLVRLLEKDGLSLRSYPSSAPSSSVGGWLAQGGGVGYGSYQYGCFRDNVISARVVLPNAQVRGFEGDDLQLVSDAEGITGFITQITLRARRRRRRSGRFISPRAPSWREP